MWLSSFKLLLATICFLLLIDTSYHDVISSQIMPACVMDQDHHVHLQQDHLQPIFAEPLSQSEIVENPPMKDCHNQVVFHEDHNVSPPSISAVQSEDCLSMIGQQLIMIVVVKIILM